MTTIYFLSQLFETVAVCVDWEIIEDDSIWSSILRYKAIFLITVMLFSNTLISVKTLPELWKQVNMKSVIGFAIFMCVMFELIIIYREYIVACQDNLKHGHRTRFRRVLISYFTCCELVLYFGLIGQMIHQTILMRNKAFGKMKHSLSTYDSS